MGVSPRDMFRHNAEIESARDQNILVQVHPRLKPPQPLTKTRPFIVQNASWRYPESPGCIVSNRPRGRSRRLAAHGTHYSRFGPFLDKKIVFTYLNRPFITRIALFRSPNLWAHWTQPGTPNRGLNPKRCSSGQLYSEGARGTPSGTRRARDKLFSVLACNKGVFGALFPSLAPPRNAKGRPCRPHEGCQNGLLVIR